MTLVHYLRIYCDTTNGLIVFFFQVSSDRLSIDVSISSSDGWSNHSLTTTHSPRASHISPAHWLLGSTRCHALLSVALTRLWIGVGNQDRWLPVRDRSSGRCGSRGILGRLVVEPVGGLSDLRPSPSHSRTPTVSDFHRTVRLRQAATYSPGSGQTAMKTEL